MTRSAVVLFLACSIAACDSVPARTDADVIVVGAGIAGISAALEASAAGASVIVVEQSSIYGGHAVQAGGFALVDTPLQRAKGYTDSPQLAYSDLMAWGENADAQWVRQFVDRSRPDIYDWLADLGVRFTILLDTPEDSVPRFHFAGGTAVNAIVPMLREALDRDNIRWFMNSRVADLSAVDANVISVHTRNLRDDSTRILSAAAVILATGGFQGDLDRVREHWNSERPVPQRLLIGGSEFATGSGIRIGEAFGARTTRLQDQVTFVTGLPNPRDPRRGLHTENAAAIWVNADGLRFVNEAATSKAKEATVLGSAAQTYWMIFDSTGRRKLRVRGAEWLNPDTIVSEILDNPRISAKADSIAELAAATGLPEENLLTTVKRYNDLVAAGNDEDFQRFGGDHPITAKRLESAPYYALQLYPMTRKNLGGLAIDLQTRTLGADGEPLTGLFAAGEATGAAGINGSHGGSGTFLAPAVLTGRIAGRNAAGHARQMSVQSNTGDTTAEPQADPVVQRTFEADELVVLIGNGREGYRHFEDAHRVVIDRDYACDRCHSGDWPIGPATTRRARIAQLESCTLCH